MSKLAVFLGKIPFVIETKWIPFVKAIAKLTFILLAVGFVLDLVGIKVGVDYTFVKGILNRILELDLKSVVVVILGIWLYDMYKK